LVEDSAAGRAGGLYNGIDETSFRGEFLKNCANVVDKRLLDAAWEHKLPAPDGKRHRAMA
jgi:hypothetical protein